MNTTDRYAKIREALEMGPTPGPFIAERSYSAGNQELIIHLTYNDEYGFAKTYCTVRNSLGDEWKTEANAALIAACDPDTIRELLAERDALAAENERLKEDRARFPDSPDDSGRMIEAHIGNLKAGKKSAEDLAVKVFERACRAEAALAEKDQEIAALRAERDFLQEILDARPAINAALPESYIRWSQSIYSGEAARASLEARNEGGKDADRQAG